MASRRIGLLLLLPVCAQALTPLDDSSLSSINGQDGLTVDLESAVGISAENLA